MALLKDYDPSLEVLACLESIEETVRYLKQKPHPDLLLLDIHLSDGHSFEIFRQVNYNKPVIFTTAYDNYALDAFKHFSIDYILKPVTLESLAAALQKLKSLATGLPALQLNSLLPGWSQDHCKKRFLGKVGQRLFFIDVSDIGFFQADNKIVYLVDQQGNRFVVDHTLETLETMLDPRQFFRLNRRFIVRINAIEQVKPYYNNRLKLEIKGCHHSEDMVISRDRVAAFKQWAEA
jgi:DNA-binding LytR/AlgR family response regulator